MIPISDFDVMDNVLRAVKRDGKRSVLVFTQDTKLTLCRRMKEIAKTFSKKGYKVKVHEHRLYFQVIDNGAHVYFGNFLYHEDTSSAHSFSGMVFDRVIYNRIPQAPDELPRCSAMNYVASRVRM